MGAIDAELDAIGTTVVEHLRTVACNDSFLRYLEKGIEGRAYSELMSKISRQSVGQG